MSLIWIQKAASLAVPARLVRQAHPAIPAIPVTPVTAGS